MERVHSRSIFKAILVTLTLLVGLAPASGLAGLLISGSMTLNVSNTYAPVLPYAELEFDLFDDGQFVLTLTQSAGSGIGNGTNYGFASFGFNVSDAILDGIDDSTILVSAVNGPGTGDDWDLDFNKSQDGFGKFEVIVVGDGSSRQNPLVVTVSGLSGLMTDFVADSLPASPDWLAFVNSNFVELGDKGKAFAAHEAGITNAPLSHWIASTGPFTPTPGPPGEPVPEISSLLAWGAALAFCGLLLKRQNQLAA